SCTATPPDAVIAKLSADSEMSSGEGASEGAELENHGVRVRGDPQEVSRMQRAEIDREARLRRIPGRTQKPAALSLDGVDERARVARHAQHERAVARRDLGGVALPADVRSVDHDGFLGRERD